MKLAFSQIGWLPEQELEVLTVLKQMGFDGLEIAPTRVAGQDPYTNIKRAEEYAKELWDNFSIRICSMQSLWFGKSGNMFGNEREFFLDYTKQAILFAKAMGAGNLVFGSPKNRIKPEGMPDKEAVPFFKELGDFAAKNGTVIALEANPAVYGTNFMNTTKQAFDMAEMVASEGCRVNLDFGTIIINDEDVGDLEGKTSLINHVHISEPQLAMIEPCCEHPRLVSILKEEWYDGYISVEMKAQSLDDIKKVATYFRGVFR